MPEQSHKAAINALRNIYDIPQPKPKWSGEGYPQVEPPPDFLPYPRVIGGLGTLIGKSAFDMIHRFPQLKRNVKTLTTDPTGLLEALKYPNEMSMSGWPVGVHGYWDKPRGAVAINPGHSDYLDAMKVLGHEFAHAAGREHQKYGTGFAASEAEMPAYEFLKDKMLKREFK